MPVHQALPSASSAASLPGVWRPQAFKLKPRLAGVQVLVSRPDRYPLMEPSCPSLRHRPGQADQELEYLATGCPCRSCSCWFCKAQLHQAAQLSRHPVLAQLLVCFPRSVALVISVGTIACMRERPGGGHCHQPGLQVVPTRTSWLACLLRGGGAVFPINRQLGRGLCGALLHTGRHWRS